MERTKVRSRAPLYVVVRVTRDKQHLLYAIDSVWVPTQRFARPSTTTPPLRPSPTATRPDGRPHPDRLALAGSRTRAGGPEPHSRFGQRGPRFPVPPCPDRGLGALGQLANQSEPGASAASTGEDPLTSDRSPPSSGPRRPRWPRDGTCRRARRNVRPILASYAVCVMPASLRSWAETPASRHAL